jgi:hypothetical protein
MKTRTFTAAAHEVEHLPDGSPCALPWTRKAGLRCASPLEPGARPDFAKLHDGQLIRLTLGKDGQYIEHLGT